MQLTPTITATEMRGINRSAVLDVIRRHGPIARTEIARILQVSLMTVMRMVDDLMAEDLIRLTGKKDYSGGRRRPLLEFNADGHVVIGIDMNETRVYGAVVDLAGAILADLTQLQDPPGELRYEALMHVIEQLLEAAKATGKHIRGIGIGAPGITYHEADQVRWAPTLEWKDLELREQLAARFQLPVILDNDVNLSALGEMWFGIGQNRRNLVLMIVSRGIGAGVIIEGAVYRGSHLTAGEIGFLLPERSHLNSAHPGVGALESLASWDGIAARARRALQSERSPEALAALRAEDVFAAYRRGETWAEPIVSDTIDYLAQTVAALTVCYDPDVIVLSGEILQATDVLLDPIRRRLEGVIPIRPDVAASQLNRRAVILGTVIEILYHTADFYMVRKLS